MKYQIKFHRNLDRDFIYDCMNANLKEIQAIDPALPETFIYKTVLDKIDVMLKDDNGRLATCETIDGSVGFYITTLTDTTVTVEHGFFKPINGSKSYFFTPDFWYDTFASLRLTHGLKVGEVKLDPKSTIHKCITTVFPQLDIQYEIRELGTVSKLCVVQL